MNILIMLLVSGILLGIILLSLLIIMIFKFGQSNVHVSRKIREDVKKIKRQIV